MQTLKPDGSGRPVLSGGIHGGPANHATGAGTISGSARGELLSVVYELLDVCVQMLCKLDLALGRPAAVSAVNAQVPA